MQGTTTAGIDGHTAAATHTNGRTGPAAPEQPKDDRFSDLLTAAGTGTNACTQQTQKPAKAQTDSNKNAAAANNDQTVTIADHGGNTPADKTGKTVVQNADTKHTNAGGDGKDPVSRINVPKADVPKTNTTGTGTTQTVVATAGAASGAVLSATATDERSLITAGAEDIPTRGANVKDTDKEGAYKKDAGKKDGDGKQAGPDQTGTGVNITTAQTAPITPSPAIPNPAIPNMVQAANTAGQQNASTGTDVSAGTASRAGMLATANPAPASGQPPRDNHKADPKDVAKPQPSAPNGASSTAAATSRIANPAIEAAGGSVTGTLAALTGKTPGHSKDDSAVQETSTGTTLAQNVQAPANLPSQQGTQDTSQPSGPASGQGAQGLGFQSAVPDPSALGAGSAGIHSLIATAPQGTGTSAGTGAGAAGALMPQTLQINQMPLPLPNMAQLGIAIAARSLSGSRQFDIRLDPPELGRVDVRLSIDSTGKAQAHLSADQQQTLELLQKDSSGLARALRDAGLNVAQNGLNFSLRQQGSGGGAGHGGFSPRGARTQALSAVASLTSAPSALSQSVLSRSLSGHGRIDISV